MSPGVWCCQAGEGTAGKEAQGDTLWAVPPPGELRCPGHASRQSLPHQACAPPPEPLGPPAGVGTYRPSPHLSFRGWLTPAAPGTDAADAGSEREGPSLLLGLLLSCWDGPSRATS